jgi:hypothetical protein
LLSVELNAGQANVENTRPLKNILFNVGTLNGCLEDIYGHAEFNLGSGSLKLNYLETTQQIRTITMAAGFGDIEIYLPQKAHPYIQEHSAPFVTTVTNAFTNIPNNNDFKIDTCLGSGTLKILKK